MSSISSNADGKKPAKKSDQNNEPTVKALLEQYIELGKKINAKRDELKDPNNAMDMPVIRSELSSLFLEAAAVGRRILSYAEEDKVKNLLIERLHSPDAVKLLEGHVASHIDNAKKYGSSIKSDVPATTLDDIKGQENVKNVVRSFIFMAKHPELFETYKMKGGLGMMMYGAPGTGKTMFAEAIAHEMNLPLFVITPADIFKSYVGASEQAVRQIFQDISSCADGAVLFIDECESIFTKRSADTKETKSAVTSELLQRMNGEGVDGSKRIMIAATNRPWDIDPAYLRYKRFSHLIHIEPPDKNAIKAIVDSKLKDIPHEEEKDWESHVADFFINNTAKARKILDPNPDEQKDEEAVRLYDENEVGLYSAADICGIIEEACRMAIEETMRAAIEQGDNAEIKPKAVTFDMIRAASAKRKPSITVADLRVYDNFSPDSMTEKTNNANLNVADLLRAAVGRADGE